MHTYININISVALDKFVAYMLAKNVTFTKF